MRSFGAVAKQITTTSHVMSVCLSVLNSISTTVWILIKFHIHNFYSSLLT